MAKECFLERTFRDDSTLVIRRANQIITDYLRQGYRLTLRQLYYQFVSKNWIANTERSYKRLGSIISDGRLAGLIDWDAIEDRVRVPRVPTEFDDLEQLCEAAVSSYRLPRWKGQCNYVELWVEKDALAGVLQPLASEYHVTMMVNRGYSSQSAMYEAANRFQIRGEDCEKHLLYLGDHDPSGEDMVRDVRDRLEMFGVSVHVKKIALTMAQVEEHEPPPNPAKMTDSRAGAYVAQHGAESWEVDALPPNVLAELIRHEILGLVDLEEMETIKEQEQTDTQELLKAVRTLMKRRNK